MKYPFVEIHSTHIQNRDKTFFKTSYNVTSK